jgi:predicted nucleic acid-binding protein
VIVADTSGILASIDANAADHDGCARAVRESDEPLLVSHMVVAEVDYLLTTRFGVAAANRFLSDVVTGAYLLAPTDEGDLAEAVNVNTRYADQVLGVTDCLNVVLAARYGTIRILTLDERHFRVVKPLGHGSSFELLPADAAIRPPPLGARGGGRWWLTRW